MHKSHFLHKFKKYFEEVKQNIIHKYLLEAHAINLSCMGKTSTTVSLRIRERKKAKWLLWTFYSNRIHKLDQILIMHTKLWKMKLEQNDNFNFSAPGFNCIFNKRRHLPAWNDQWILAVEHLHSVVTAIAVFHNVYYSSCCSAYVRIFISFFRSSQFNKN